MKLTAGIIAGVCLLLAAPSSEAGLFGKKGRRLPKPIDYPIVRKKERQDHKAGKRAGVHPAQYLKWDWGRRKGLFKIAPTHFGRHEFYDRYE